MIDWYSTECVCFAEMTTTMTGTFTLDPVLNRNVLRIFSNFFLRTCLFKLIKKCHLNIWKAVCQCASVLPQKRSKEKDNPIWAQHELGMTLSRAADFLVETKIGICRFFCMVSKQLFVGYTGWACDWQCEGRSTVTLKGSKPKINSPELALIQLLEYPIPAAPCSVRQQAISREPRVWFHRSAWSWSLC